MVSLTTGIKRVQNNTASEPFYCWDWPDGTPWARFYRISTGYLIRFPAIADFEISADGQRVTCAAVPDVSNVMTDHLYRNQVLPLALSTSGQLVFHGSAVEIADRSIAFLGESGRGKSTLAAAFAVNGHRFLTDDGLVLEQAGGVYYALPSHPSLRLWEDSHSKLFERDVDVAPALAFTSKARFLAGTRLNHCNSARQLRTAYFIGDGSAPDFRVRRLTPAETMIAWAMHSFRLDVEDRALIGRHFDQISDLANSVVCYEIDYPRRFDNLDRLLDDLIAHTTGLK